MQASPLIASRTEREKIEGARQSQIWVERQKNPPKPSPLKDTGIRSAEDRDPEVLYLNLPETGPLELPMQVLQAAAIAENWYVPPYKPSFWRRLKRLIGL